ncbi:MAG: LytR/AlgR family response regulator transcription factor [Muribaculaceae bacterium]
MKYAIIENEEFARINLQMVIETVRPDYVCAFTAETVEECVKRFSSAGNDIQLIFMDIELDDGNCFEIFQRTAVKTPIIFTTAYDEYAIRAFKVNSIDYLLKPVTEENVECAIKKFESMQPGIQVPDYGKLSGELSGVRKRQRILLSTATGYSFVSIDDIAWVEAEDKYVSIVLKTGKRAVTDFASLADVMEILDQERFFQLSRAVVTSIDAIYKISKFLKGRLMVTLMATREERTETVSAARRPGFLEWLGHSPVK